jgi:hypothetical protein
VEQPVLPQLLGQRGEAEVGDLEPALLVEEQVLRTWNGDARQSPRVGEWRASGSSWEGEIRDSSYGGESWAWGR